MSNNVTYGEYRSIKKLLKTHTCRQVVLMSHRSSGVVELISATADFATYKARSGRYAKRQSSTSTKVAVGTFSGGFHLDNKPGPRLNWFWRLIKALKG